MRAVLLLALALAGCGFDGGDPPTTFEECAKKGGSLVVRGDWWVCDVPADLAYAAAKNAQVTPGGDAGAHD